MKKCYAKVIVEGSPITKSNFKLFNTQGRAILPYNTGKYYDRYAIYEEEIALKARSQNPDIVLDEALIAILKVYYKSEKRHPDTNNVTKSIFDGIEKSGLIINDAQIRRIIIEEFYDKENPRFELELFGESSYKINYEVLEKASKDEKITYCPPPNTKGKLNKNTKNTKNKTDSLTICSICGKKIKNNDFITGDKGRTIICKSCLGKML
ncbi:RusA family crossover junction endodeoxyribonuclease [Clostridium fallax]|uniref:Holliday junction resolvase RusA (Prophage-encoded endonuclease) n=1 Tax=Clostridium fallax TaxID=1533 RepID=A0A1M4WFH7_9CLOT|nr:RusA family crossover junction endodeoxyribonuclease [Clostridium fallax]SHE80009.1 Holliday junction resolvase RusA (prophage-encoded endonuclease) [Clostridium fallax]SQB04945.1 endodeoxyribonuclease RusA [Clostridium fallax]